MPEATLAVARGEFTIDRLALDAVIVAHWPERRYIEINTGRRARSLIGQYQVPAGAETPLVVDVERTGKALDIIASSDVMAAELIAAVTGLPGFPADGSVVLAEWSGDVIALHPHTTAEELLRQLD